MCELFAVINMWYGDLMGQWKIDVLFVKAASAWGYALINAIVMILGFLQLKVRVAGMAQ